MKWLTKSVALLFLVLWVPVTQHCRLETIFGLDFLACGPHFIPVAHQESDCDDDGCATVEEGDYFVPDASPELIPPMGLLAAAWPSLVEAPEPPQISPDAACSPSPAPPDLAASWRFVVRAAPLPRAPSLPV
jgi:hypothetical protein